MKPFNYTVVGSADEAVQLKQENSSSKFIAGGSNIIDMMKEGIQRPNQLLDISKLDLVGIEVKDNTLIIGALVSNTEAAEDKTVLQKAPLVSQSIVKGATQQIRNMASIAGNLMQETRCPYFYDITSNCNRRKDGSGCSALETGNDRGNAIFGTSKKCIAVHPSDMAVGMMALGVRVNLRHQNGERTLTLNEFYKEPGRTPETITNLKDGELITSIEIPLDNGFNHSAYLKVRDRKSYAFALISGAAVLTLNKGIIIKAGIAAGGVGTIPWFFKDASAYLRGKEPSQSNFESAAKIAVKGAKSGNQNGFKKELLERIIIRTLLMAKRTPYGN